MLDLEKFIKGHITQRSESLLAADLETNHNQLIDQINERSVMVIGGAGTIGSSYIKALLRYRPSRLFVFDTNENALTELTRDLRSSTGLNIPADYRSYPINFGDPIFYKILEREGPFEIVANFAAHKHVRSEKDHYSIEAMLQNNVVLTKKLLDHLLRVIPEHFFCVSTDKATNPVNVMGASKKIMEEVLMTYAQQMPVTTARFANVAFSNGSLLQGFLERIMKNQPLSAPNDVRRYFVSPEESGELCLLASILGKPGEIFFPQLGIGSMKTFSAIAIEFLEAWGYEPFFCSSEDEARQLATKHEIGQKEYPVYFFESETSGEKLFEEFYTEHEQVDFKRFRALGVIRSLKTKSIPEIDAFILSLEKIFNGNNVDKTLVVKFLADFLPDFNHIETGFSLDQKM
ncbi:MAG: polysaccharide biosynthesis protein [Saprospiraceae bacterium]|nr:polysaccharide biosynthesis protein [Saprospiraceae bacterium]